MPTVPVDYSPLTSGVNPGTPVSLGPSRMNVENITPDAFGAPQARALEKLGQQFQTSGNEAEGEAIRWQNIYNTSEANDLDVKAMQRIGEIQNEFYLKQGKGAKDALPDYMQEIQKVREEALAGASSPAVARSLDLMLTKRVGFAMVDGGRHASQQEKVYINRANEAKVQLAQATSIGIDVDGPRFKDNLNEIDKAINLKADSESWDPVTRAQELGKAKAGAYGTNLIAGSVDHPLEAMALFQKHKDAINKLDPNIGLQIEQKLQQAVVTNGSRVVADRVTAGSQGYYDTLRGKEFGNGSKWKNDNSSAEGPYQITDGTWKDIAKAHPELGLTNKQDVGQQEKAIRAFTADNAQVLRDAGIASTEKNLYMAHFLGAKGAVKLINAMQTDPDQSASAVVGAAAANANSSIFAGRSVKEVYALQTARFKDSPFGSERGDLTSQLTQGQVQAAAVAKAAGLDGAKAVEFQEAVATRIKTKFNGDIAVKRDEDLANLFTVQTAMYDSGDKVKSYDDLVKSSPEVAKALDALNPKIRQSVMNEIERNQKRDTQVMTDERLAAFSEARGRAFTDPAGFLKEDIMAMDVPTSAKKQLLAMQQSIQKTASADPQISSMISQLKLQGAFEGLGISLKESPNNKRYYDLIGKFTTLVQGFQQANARPPDLTEQKKILGSLVARDNPGVPFVPFTGGKMRFEEAISVDQALEMQKQWKQKYPDRSPLTSKDMQEIYLRKRAQEALR